MTNRWLLPMRSSILLYLRALLLLLLALLAVRQILQGSWRVDDLQNQRQQSSTQSPQQHSPKSAATASEVELCFVIRTYWGHGAPSGSPLANMLAGLVNSTHNRWKALILVMDSKPFSELDSIIRSFHDPRISIFANKIGESHHAKLEDGSWNPKYHDDLYALTDDAIRACAPTTDWVIITNGDNEYDAGFIPAILSAPAGADIIAFDFYSRYQRVTATPCERFAAEPGAPPCKENLMRFCNTDLAATIYRWPRFMAEDRAFAKMESHGIGLNDGLLARLLRDSGWKVHRISDRCLLSHSPSPQLCALRGGVWDDSLFLMFQHSGGRCLDMEEAEQHLKATAGLEVVEVNVSHDGASFGFEAGKAVQLACIRQKFEAPWVNKWYPAQCAALFDGGEDY